MLTKDAQSNTINFPAGILQPPSSRSIGGCGELWRHRAIIGHEINSWLRRRGAQVRHHGNCETGGPPTTPRSMRRGASVSLTSTRRKCLKQPGSEARMAASRREKTRRQWRPDTWLSWRCKTNLARRPARAWTKRELTVSRCYSFLPGSHSVGVTVHAGVNSHVGPHQSSFLSEVPREQLVATALSSGGPSVPRRTEMGAPARVPRLVSHDVRQELMWRRTQFVVTGSLALSMGAWSVRRGSPP